MLPTYYVVQWADDGKSAKVTKQSPLTGKANTMELPITREQFTEWREKRAYIQTAMPHLSKEQREFLISGYTPEDWNMLFGECDGN